MKAAFTVPVCILFSAFPTGKAETLFLVYYIIYLRVSGLRCHSVRVEIKGQLVVVASLYHVGLGAPTQLVRLGQVLPLLPVVCVYRGRGKWEVIQKLGVPLHYEWFHLPLISDRGK